MSSILWWKNLHMVSTNAGFLCCRNVLDIDSFRVVFFIQRFQLFNTFGSLKHQCLCGVQPDEVTIGGI